MLQIVRKTNHKIVKELTVFSAEGSVISVDGKERTFLEEREEVGKINLDEFRGNLLVGGTISVGDSNHRVAFERVKPEKWNGRVGKLRIGRSVDSNGSVRFEMTEKLHEQDSWWIFKSGYIYYELEDKQEKQKYLVKDICFGPDMHFYYIYNMQNELVTAIYKPFRQAGHDEYHVYTKDNAVCDAVLFAISYIDFFLYPFNRPMHGDSDDMYHDDAAYQLSDDELLTLYDDNFVRSVILNG